QRANRRRRIQPGQGAETIGAGVHALACVRCRAMPNLGAVAADVRGVATVTYVDGVAADVRGVATVTYVDGVAADVRGVATMADVRGAVARKAQRQRGDGEQCAEDEAREKDAFHGAVWLVVYSSFDGVSTYGTARRRN